MDWSVSVLRSVVALALVLLLPSAARGQRVELAGGAALPIYQSGGSYDSRYVPPFPFVEHTGTATQRLSLERATRPAWWGALTWFPREHFGVEFRASHRRTPLGGTNGPHRVALTYATRQPPDNVLRQFQYERSSPWPDTAGDVDTFGLDGSFLVAAGSARGTQFRAGGGLTLMAVSGRFAPLGVSSFQLGGHAVLFATEQQVAMEAQRAWALGVHTIVEVRHALTPRVAFAAGARILLPRTVATDTRVRATVLDGGPMPLTLDAAEQALRPMPLSLRLTALDLLVGLRFTL